jgi:integral membrane sensor domain MASE1
MDRRALRNWGYAAAGGVMAIAVIYAVEIIAYGPIGHGLGLGFRVATITLGAAVAAAGLAVFLVIGFRGLDEFTQQASRFSWYWGSAMGVLAALPVYLFVISGGLNLIEGVSVTHLPPAEARARAGIFALGFLLPLVCQAIGFLVVRAWWALSKR